MTQRKRKVTWLVTLDGARANFYRLARDGDRLRLIPTGAMEGTRKLTQDLTSDRPGHTQESVGGARHAMEPRTTAHDHAEQTFIAQVAHELAAKAAEKAFDDIIVVAAPRALGTLRQDFDGHFAGRYVSLEIPGDWTKMSPDDAACHLRPHLAEHGH
jgi:protein required for attachment to host cells